MVLTIRCYDQIWGFRYIIMGHLVRVMFQSHGGHNIGAVPLKGMTTPDGKPVLLVRTQARQPPLACLVLTHACLVLPLNSC